MRPNKYKKDYSGKTAEEWFAAGKWTGFLMRVPLNKALGYICKRDKDVSSIRTIASIMNNDADCPRKFEIVANFDTMVVTVTATLK